MLSQIYAIPCKVNNQPWSLYEYLGSGFETHIFQVFSYFLKPYIEKGATIIQTPSSRDDGKDIVVESPVALESFLGYSFPLKEKGKIKIYIECKSSNSGNIPYNQFAGNLSRVKDDNIDYYILVTNTTISPYSYFQFSQELQALGISFYLFDQLLLSQFLKTMNAHIGDYSSLQETPNSNVEYQVLSTFHNGQPVYDLFLLIRNYQDCAINFNLNLNTDRNWNISQRNIQDVIAPYACRCIKLIIQRQYYDGLNELLLTLEIQGKETFTKIKGVNWKSNFIPPLCGKEHKNIISELTNLVLNSKSYHFSYLWGEAGVGKTRIIDELLANVQCRGVEVAVFRCMQGKQGINQEIKDFLIRKNFLSKYSQSISLPDMLLETGSNFQRCLIIIDDLHNADNTLLLELKQAAQLKHQYPVVLLVVGRNDFSVGDLDYYSFQQWCSSTLKQKGKILAGLDQEDAKTLIRLIIEDIPQFALDKIFNLSNCNPLFIVETIEYLLEMKLVHVINRSSVGIQNPESFSSKLYIPTKIEDIYEKRFKSLLQIECGEELQNFLLACSLLGVNFKYDVASSLFDNPEENLKELLQRRFLTYSADGRLQFVHESLFLFFKRYISTHQKKRQKVALMIYKLNNIFRSLSELQQGQICLWAGYPSKALICFQPTLYKISLMENHSNVKVDRKCYEYLEDMYECVSEAFLQEKILLYKLYISLHYYTPYISIENCQWAKKQIAKNSKLKNRNDLLLMLKEHEAHSYLNAGQLKKADIILQELLATTICTPHCLTSQTLFDLYDKLSNLNIKYNNFSIAEKYIDLAEKTALTLNDKKLEALAYITHAKLLFYQNPVKASKYLQRADVCMDTGGIDRINMHNRITQLILSLSFSEIKPDVLEKMKAQVKTILDECVEHQFSSSIIRAYLLLGTLYLLSTTNPLNTQIALSYFKEGIDASLRFGIGTYIWQIYNQLAILSIKQKEPLNKTARLFDTVFQQLRQQNLLNLNNTNLCYGNLLAISNVASFYAVHKFESAFYQKMTQISFFDATPLCDYDCGKKECNYICEHSTELFAKELKRYQNTPSGKLPVLFQKKIPISALWDEETKYYIILS